MLRRVRKFWSKYGTGYLFVFPALLFYLVFMVYSFFYSSYLSLTEWNGADPVKKFIGFGNYVKMSQDYRFWLCLKHNIQWTIVGAILPISFGLFLAMLLWSRPRGFMTFRSLFFLPQILGPGVRGVMFQLIYQPRTGILCQIGKALNWKALQFSLLANPHTVLWAVLFADIWSAVGFFFVILLAGLQNVDMDLLDAAKVDGANGIQRFSNVVIPQLSHVLTMVTVLALIGGLKVFGIIWAMTQGGPANRTDVLATYAYLQFSYLSEVGYAAAFAVVIAFLALGTSVVFIRARERREV